MTNFCRKCIKDTTEESSGDCYTMGGSGTRLYWSKNKCTECGSIVQDKYHCFFLIPFQKVGRFRTLPQGRGKFISRKLKGTEILRPEDAWFKEPFAKRDLNKHLFGGQKTNVKQFVMVFLIIGLVATILLGWLVNN